MELFKDGRSREAVPIFFSKYVRMYGYMVLSVDAGGGKGRHIEIVSHTGDCGIPIFSPPPRPDVSPLHILADFNFQKNTNKEQ
jgi:hypothetical protein